MRKQELVGAIKSNIDCTTETAVAAIDAVFTQMKTSMKEEGRLFIDGFGSFTVKIRPERNGRNPKTGEVIKIASRKSIGFKSAKELKQFINDTQSKKTVSKKK